MNQKIYWASIAGIAIVGLGLGFIVPFFTSPNPINQPLIGQQAIRASGFTMKAESLCQKDPKTGKYQVYARMFATGPMHDAEVIRMEGEWSLITPDGKIQSFGPSSWTFSENLVATIPIPSPAKDAKVKVTGKVYVYHREDIKSEREMMKDGAVRLYMNTGTVTFRKVPNSKPPKVEVECLDLGTVHMHGLELVGADKKTVSHRLLLMAGKQLIERENLPYVGRQIGMEPYIIRQLIPWRDEPVTLVVPVQESR